MAEGRAIREADRGRLASRRPRKIMIILDTDHLPSCSAGRLEATRQARPAARGLGAARCDDDHYLEEQSAAGSRRSTSCRPGAAGGAPTTDLDDFLAFYAGWRLLLSIRSPPTNSTAPSREDPHRHDGSQDRRRSSWSFKPRCSRRISATSARSRDYWLKIGWHDRELTMRTIAASVGPRSSPSRSW